MIPPVRVGGGFSTNLGTVTDTIAYRGPTFARFKRGRWVALASSARGRPVTWWSPPPYTKRIDALKTPIRRRPKLIATSCDSPTGNYQAARSRTLFEGGHLKPSSRAVVPARHPPTLIAADLAAAVDLLAFWRWTCSLLAQPTSVLVPFLAITHAVYVIPCRRRLSSRSRTSPPYAMARRPTAPRWKRLRNRLAVLAIEPDHHLALFAAGDFMFRQAIAVQFFNQFRHPWFHGGMCFFCSSLLLASSNFPCACLPPSSRTHAHYYPPPPASSSFPDTSHLTSQKASSHGL